VVRLALNKLKPEEKVNLSIDMTDVCVRVCADAIRDRGKALEEEELMDLVRARVMYGKRRHREV